MDRIESVVSNETYKKFAKLYKISQSELVDGKRRKKNILLLRSQIKEYEKNNKVKDGLYF